MFLPLVEKRERADGTEETLILFDPGVSHIHAEELAALPSEAQGLALQAGIVTPPDYETGHYTSHRAPHAVLKLPEIPGILEDEGTKADLNAKAAEVAEDEAFYEVLREINRRKHEEGPSGLPYILSRAGTKVGRIPNVDQFSRARRPVAIKDANAGRKQRFASGGQTSNSRYGSLSGSEQVPVIAIAAVAAHDIHPEVL